MENIVLDSSSDDDCDDYSNSASTLKALKQRKDQEYQIEIERKEKEKQEIERKEKEKQEIEKRKREAQHVAASTNMPRQVIRPQTRQVSRGGRNERTRASQSEMRQLERRNNDPDLEIVSVEQNSNRNNLENPEANEDDLIFVADTKSLEENAAVPSDDEDYDVNMNIFWVSRYYHRFKICRNEKFQKIFDFFANLEGVSVDEILITKDDKIIKKSDTPKSINFRVIDILEGGVVKKSTKFFKKDSCVIKVQTKSRKVTIKITLEKTESFEKLFTECAEKLSIEKSKMKIYFDGEIVDENDTPENLEIDDEACFDLVS